MENDNFKLLNMSCTRMYKDVPVCYPNSHIVRAVLSCKTIPVDITRLFEESASRSNQASCLLQESLWSIFPAMLIITCQPHNQSSSIHTRVARQH